MKKQNEEQRTNSYFEAREDLLDFQECQQGSIGNPGGWRGGSTRDAFPQKVAATGLPSPTHPSGHRERLATLSWRRCLRCPRGVHAKALRQSSRNPETWTRRCEQWVLQNLAAMKLQTSMSPIRSDCATVGPKLWARTSATTNFSFLHTSTLQNLDRVQKKLRLGTMSGLPTLLSTFLFFRGVGPELFLVRVKDRKRGTFPGVNIPKVTASGKRPASVQYESRRRRKSRRKFRHWRSHGRSLRGRLTRCRSTVNQRPFTPHRIAGRQRGRC